MLISRDLQKKSSEVSIKAKSTPGSLSFKGQETKHTTVKWSIHVVVKTRTANAKRTCRACRSIVFAHKPIVLWCIRRGRSCVVPFAFVRVARSSHMVMNLWSSIITPAGSPCPALFDQSACGIFNVSKSFLNKGFETGATVYGTLSEKT